MSDDCPPHGIERPEPFQDAVILGVDPGNELYLRLGPDGDVAVLTVTDAALDEGGDELAVYLSRDAAAELVVALTMMLDL